MTIIHAKIYTMEQNVVIEDGFVSCDDGKICAVGDMAQWSGGDAIDAGGAMLFPGFIDGHTHLGMWENGIGFEGDDGNEDTDPTTPQLRAMDAVNPMDECFREARSAGITTVVTGPGSANAIGGQLIAVKTMGGRIDDMLLKAPLAMKMALGENPKTVYHEKNQSPVTRMATASLIREMLYKAKRYEEQLRAVAHDQDTDPPEFDSKLDALVPVINGTLPVHFHAHRTDDIFTAVRIAREFGLTFQIVHGTAGHLIADTMAKEGLSVFCGPLLCDRSKPELRELTPKNPGALSRAGVKLSIVTDHPVTPIQYLPLTAGLAVREGMDWMEALRAITIHPAEMCGIADRVGSIAVGKDADLVLFSEDPLTLSAKPELVMISGKNVDLL